MNSPNPGELKNSKTDKLQTDALVEEKPRLPRPTPSPTASGARSTTVEDVKPRAGRPFVQLFCSERGLRVPRRRRRLRPAPRLRRQLGEHLHDVVALQKFRHPGNVRLPLRHRPHPEGVAPGSGKACFCVPKGIVTTPVVDAKGDEPVDMPRSTEEETHSLFDIKAAPGMVACDSEVVPSRRGSRRPPDRRRRSFAGEYGTKGCYTYNSGKYLV